MVDRDITLRAYLVAALSLLVVPLLVFQVVVKRGYPQRGCLGVSVGVLQALASAIALAVGGTRAGVAGDPAVKADKVFVENSARRLTLLQGGKQLRVDRVALGAHPIGPKEGTTVR